MRVVLGNRRSQSGTGVATIDKRHYALNPGTLLLIERGDEHKILDNGRAMLRTLDFHVPSACDPDGDELPRGRRR